MKKLMSNLTHWKGNLRAFPLLCFLLLASNFITAQTKVQGIVSDPSGMTIPGVNVSIVGAQGSVSTNIDGKYEIDVPANATLLFSFIGYVPQKIAVKGATKINVTLKSSTEDLKEVVINVGYGTQKKKDVNSAISSIKSKIWRILLKLL
jgi:hypothetical protein